MGVSELEASASQINSSHSILLFELNGVQYTSEAVSTEAIVECSAGQGRQEAFCSMFLIHVFNLPVISLALDH